MRSKARTSGGISARGTVESYSVGHRFQVIPDGPPAAPRLALLMLLVNTSMSNENCSTGFTFKMVGYTFIQIAKKKKLIQKHFHPKTLSSKNISSKTEDNFIHDTFIQNQFRPLTLSSKTTFIPKTLNPKHLNT